MAKEAVPTVATRNDPRPLEPYAKSQATRISGEKPGFTYQWFRPEQLAEKLSKHEIGNDHTGYFMVDPWEVVSKEAITLPGPGMASAGKPTDTTVTNGELILCCTPTENHAKYQAMERLNDALIDKRLTGGEKINFGSRTSFKTRTMGGRDALEASANDILAGAS